MNDARFRALMQEAVGEPRAAPWLVEAVRKRVGQPARPSSRAPIFAVVATVVLFALLAIALVPRLLQHRNVPVTPGVVATPTSIDWRRCTLPLIAFETTKSVWTRVPGFVDTQTGTFTPASATSTSLAGLPSDQLNNGEPSATEARLDERPEVSSYSSAAGRWLPVPRDSVSPDGLSYVYRIQNWVPQSSGGAMTLMRYDIRAGTSEPLWTSTSGFFVRKWTPDGIVIGGGAFGYETPSLIVNPETGSATPFRWPAASPPTDLPDATSGGFIGYTADGEMLGWVSNAMLRNDAADTVWVFYVTASGKVVYVYKGTRAQSGFLGVTTQTDAVGDGTGIWFASLEGISIWHWDIAHGLAAVPFKVPTGSGVILSSLAGPCF